MSPAVRRQTIVISVLALAVVVLSARDAAAALIAVTTLKQKTTGIGECSLQEAIYAANFDASIAVNGYAGTTPRIVTTQCTPGSGDDTIVLPAGALLSFSRIVDDADNPAGPTANPIITSRIFLLAYGATLERTGTANFRLFTVGETGHLTLRQAYIRNFHVQGGNGGPGGGGGMGAGGAIYVMRGGLTIESSTFELNSAYGGLGGWGVGGGGGGVGGNGGNWVSTTCEYPSGDTYGGTGGGGARGDGAPCYAFMGGGGGGTLSGGHLYFAGETCGGEGGRNPGLPGTGQGTGHKASCPGGGGGGGSTVSSVFGGHDGGSGSYGGGGGGGSFHGGGAGAHGGFGGGGGGSGIALFIGNDGGGGGFGGGGGNGENGEATHGDPGSGGFLAGKGQSVGGGGGAGLGGAVFNDSGNVEIRNSTFTGNWVYGGFSTAAQDGSSGGGAILSRHGRLAVFNSTITLNEARIGGGIVVVQDSSTAPTTIVVENTIIANNGPNECAITGVATIAAAFVGNLIASNTPDELEFHRAFFFGCQGVVTTSDPQLGPLQRNDGATPTMAIGPASPAFNAADLGTSLSVDQRNSPRPRNGGADIGAYEYCADVRIGGIHFPCAVLTPIYDLEPVVDLTLQAQPAEGGTTTPAPGTHQVGLESVLALSAIPNPGFRFLRWSENVVNGSTANTTMFVQAPQTVTAFFSACSCAADVTNRVGVSLGGVTLNPITRRYVQTVTLTNTSTSALPGPISLALDNLTPGVTLSNASGTTSLLLPAGSSYINTTVTLAPGQSTALQLQFVSPGNAAFSYEPRVLAGPGSR